MICGGGREWPDLGLDVPCCLGSAMDGPERCTCWRPVHDVGQAELVAGPVVVRPAMCEDCAFRPDSPESQGSDDYESPSLHQQFFCHQGMRRLAAGVHPSGARVEVDVPDDYDPPFGLDADDDGEDLVPYRADGTPALLCAGWAAHNRAAR